jgi:hypothetical protein
MSQIYKYSAGGGGVPIETILGDTGSITGSTVTIYADNATQNSGATVKFVNSGTVSTLNVTDGFANTIIGKDAGGSGILGPAASGNTGLGFDVLSALTIGSGNTACGDSALQTLTTGTNQTAIGVSSLSLNNGSSNIGIGFSAGTDYTGTESSNIVIGHVGVTGESNVIRIGTQGSGAGEQDKCFIAGIVGVSPSNNEYVGINSSTGQLGIAPTPGSFNAITFVTHATPSYTVLTTDQFIAVDSTGGAISVLLPNAPTTGQIWTIKDQKGQSGTHNITITTVGGSVTIDGATSTLLDFAYESTRVIFDGTSYEEF